MQLGQEVHITVTFEPLGPENVKNPEKMLFLEILERTQLVGRDSLIAVPQHPAGDLSILGHLQRLLVEGVMTRREGAPQVSVLRQLTHRQHMLTITESPSGPFL